MGLHLNEITSNSATLYICGPTVHDEAHIGHARTYTQCDTLRKILRDYFQYDVWYVMNITDIDDKIIKKANTYETSVERIASHYETQFLNDMQYLNIEEPDEMPRVSEYITNILSFIETLVEKGYAYQTDTGVYFDIQKVETYGKFRTIISLSHDDDFALWKITPYNEPGWTSRFGYGRPGWHTECAAMCSEIFGDNITLHVGGCDLQFPHHENQIVQGEAYWNTSHWVSKTFHVGSLQTNDEKMSKSVGNTISIRSMIETYGWRVIRMLFIIQPYDSYMTLNSEQIEQAKTFVRTFEVFLGKMHHYKNHSCLFKQGSQEHSIEQCLRGYKSRIHSFIIHNMQVHKCIKELYSLVYETYNYIERKDEQPNRSIINMIERYVRYMLSIFGIIWSTNNVQNIVPYIDTLCSFREKIRQHAKRKKDFELFALCDELRDTTLPNLGIHVNDSSNGNQWYYCEKN